MDDCRLANELSAVLMELKPPARVLLMGSRLENTWIQVFVFRMRNEYRF
jgi:hypothetical protein